MRLVRLWFSTDISDGMKNPIIILKGLNSVETNERWLLAATLKMLRLIQNTQFVFHKS